MAAKMRHAMRVLDDVIARSLADVVMAHGAALSPASQFVLSRALTSVLWAAVMEESDLLDTAEFEAQLCHMVAATLLRDSPSDAGHAEPVARPAATAATIA
jgi:hypothetical protein